MIALTMIVATVVTLAGGAPAPPQDLQAIAAATITGRSEVRPPNYAGPSQQQDALAAVAALITRSAPKPSTTTDTRLEPSRDRQQMLAALIVGSAR